MARGAGSAGMVGGQALDLAYDKLGEPKSPDLAHVTRLQGMKTGALIRVACEAGAILGHASAEQRAALVRYGEALGVAFQIADDLLDIEGDASVVGKAVGKDQNKATMAALLGMSRPGAPAALKQEAIDVLAPFGPRADTLRAAARFVVERKS